MKVSEYRDDEQTYSLADDFELKVMKALRRKFSIFNHSPSPEIMLVMHWFPETIRRMLRGSTGKIVICDWPCGVGKTTALTCSLSEIDPAIGAVIFMSRIEQIENFIRDAALPEDRFAVLVADNELTRGKVPFAKLGIGAENADKAQFLIITKAMAYKHLLNRSWASAASLFYNGQPRPLCVADEEMVRRQSYTVNAGSIKVATGILEKRGVCPALQRYGQAVVPLIEQGRPGSAITLPEIEVAVDYEEVQDRLKIPDVKYAGNDLRNLVALSKTTHALCREGDDGRSVLLNYEVKLPHDMPSILVLDAGARNKAVYQLQPETIEWLPIVEKRFDNVTVLIEHGPSGAHEFWNNPEERIADSAAFIKAHPDKTPLVLYSQEQWWRNKGDIAGLYGKYLSPEELAKQHRVHWGAHDSVNDHRDCDLVDVLTLYHKPGYAYEIDAHAAADRPIRKGVAEDDVKAVKDSHIALSLYQAVERSCARVLDQNQAKPCLIRLRVPYQSSVATWLPTLFPGIKIVQPERVNRESQVLAFLDEWEANRQGLTVTYPEIYEALGMLPANFTPLMKRPIMQAALKVKGWKVVKSRPSYLIKQNAQRIVA